MPYTENFNFLPVVSLRLQSRKRETKSSDKPFGNINCKGGQHIDLNKHENSVKTVKRE